MRVSRARERGDRLKHAAHHATRPKSSFGGPDATASQGWRDWGITQGLVVMRGLWQWQRRIALPSPADTLDGNCVPKGISTMLGKASIIGGVAVILMIPTALSAQMGGVVNPGVHVGGAINPGATVRGAVERGIPGPDLRTWRAPREVHRNRKHSKAVTKQRR
jgi:hypothetical protein